MKRGIWILVVGVLLISCEKKGQRRYWESYDETPVVERTAPDSITTPTQKDTVKHEDTKKSTEKVNSTGKVNSTSSDYNNMRSFDPASENDMDDNGMSRYMENNDEEGWE